MSSGIFIPAVGPLVFRGLDDYSSLPVLSVILENVHFQKLSFVEKAIIKVKD